MAESKSPQKNGSKRRGIHFSTFGFLIFMLLMIAVVTFLAWQAGYLDQFFPQEQTAAEISTQTTSQDPTPESSPSPPEMPTEETEKQTEIPSPTTPPNTDGTLPGLIVLSMSEAGYSHLFAYHPETLPLTRLTFGDWDDHHPAISPDGTKIAFTSNRSGYWDLYLLDITTGDTTQLTDDMAYNGHPAWSSDGLWLAYEKYSENNLDIFIKPVVAGIQETRVTTHIAHDYEPVWKPGSTTIAYTSTQTGSQDIFLVDTSKRITPVNYTNNPTTNQVHPAWSPNGSLLYWMAEVDGFDTLFSADIRQEAAKANQIFNTDLMSWDPTGDFLVSIQITPEQNYLSILNNQDYSYVLLPTQLPGQVNDVSWGINMLPQKLPSPIIQAILADPETPWKDKLIPSTGALYGRQNIIDLPDIKAPHAALSALAVEPFYALKDRAALSLGWDVLSDLENMFVSISEPLPPGRENDWLYTGRAFSLNPVLIDFEFMTVVREDYGAEIFWRIFLKPLDQSGKQGSPLTQFPWDFGARYSGIPSAYESGGEQLSEIPTGYWVDFTSLAAEYGWERQSALSNWQSYYQGARFNVFAITSGLSWEDAMLQVWPPEVLQTQESP